MVMQREDIYPAPDRARNGALVHRYFRKEGATGAHHGDMVEFLRGRYRDYKQQEKPPVDDRRFIQVNLSTADDGAEKRVWLYFQKADLYLRGWTNGVDPATAFVPAWDSTEWGKSPAEKARLLPEGSNNVGATTGRYLSLSYEKNENTGKYTESNDLDLSVFQFFNCVDSLHSYLEACVRDGGGAQKRIKETQKCFELLARMTAEMARFEPYRKMFCDNWSVGVDQAMRPVSRNYWAGTQEMPPFYFVIKKWQDFSKAAGGGTQFTIKFDANSIAVDMPKAEEVLGTGARWKDK
jgi:hypothetical protein